MESLNTCWSIMSLQCPVCYGGVGYMSLSLCRVYHDTYGHPPLWACLCQQRPKLTELVPITEVVSNPALLCEFIEARGYEPRVV
jgi:hypothetical protein